MFLVTLPSLIMLIYAKYVSPSTFWYTLFYILVYTFLHFGIHFFINLYLFNTATDQVYFWHACTLGPGLYSPNVFGDAALINYANLCKICQSVNILVYTCLHFGIHFFIGLYLFNTATDRVYFWHACTLSPPHTVRFLVVRCCIAGDCPISLSVRGSAIQQQAIFQQSQAIASHRGNLNMFKKFLALRRDGFSLDSRTRGDSPPNVAG